jgi:D-alanine-D-alanine ligase-like ATP-grasp enzyme
MRICARAAGILCLTSTPSFYDDLHAWIAHVPPPWLLKPRQEAGAVGIKRCEDAEQGQRWLDQLGTERSRRLLERFISSQVFHVDALVWGAG